MPPLRFPRSALRALISRSPASPCPLLPIAAILAGRHAGSRHGLGPFRTPLGTLLRDLPRLSTVSGPPFGPLDPPLDPVSSLLLAIAWPAGNATTQAPKAPCVPSRFGRPSAGNIFNSRANNSTGQSRDFRQSPSPPRLLTHHGITHHVHLSPATEGMRALCITLQRLRPHQPIAHLTAAGAAGTIAPPPRVTVEGLPHVTASAGDVSVPRLPAGPSRLRGPCVFPRSFQRSPRRAASGVLVSVSRGVAHPPIGSCP